MWGTAVLQVRLQDQYFDKAVANHLTSLESRQVRQSALLKENPAGTISSNENHRNANEDIQLDAPAFESFGISPVYVPEWLLDIRPTITVEISRWFPLNPQISKPNYLQLRLFINQEGGVDDVQIIASDLPEGEVQLAADRYLAMRFSPGRAHGVAIRSIKEIGVEIGGHPPPLLP